MNVTTSSSSTSSVSLRATQAIDFANTAAPPSENSGGASQSTPGTTSGGTAGSPPCTGVCNPAPVPTGGASSQGGAAQVTLCIGQNGKCNLQQVGPSSLHWPPALALYGGESKSVVFSNAGTYHITIENQPNANLTVTVTS